MRCKNAQACCLLACLTSVLHAASVRCAPRVHAWLYSWLPLTARISAVIITLRARTMASTSSQPRPRERLLSLDDDTLRNVLLFLSIADSRRGPGETSKALRQAVASSQLARARATAPYVLCGDTHGVVRSLATSFGTQEWPTRLCTQETVQFMAKVPPQRLEIHVERKRIGPIVNAWVNEAGDRCFKSNMVDPRVDFPYGSECVCHPRSFAEYRLPFQLRISHFRLGHGRCGAHHFKNWVFEAYDGDRLEWHTLYESNGVSPWEDTRNRSNETLEVKCFDVDAFTSTRFRIRLTGLPILIEVSCFHLRAFELFGTVLPPWQV